MEHIPMPRGVCMIVRDHRAADEIRNYAFLTKPFIVKVGEDVTGRRYQAILISRHTHSEMLSVQSGYDWWFQMMLNRLNVGGKVIYLD